MNMHLSPQDPAFRAHLDFDAEDPEMAARRKRKTWAIVALSVLAVVAFIAFLVWKARAEKPQTPPPPPPTVTLVVPGTSQVAARVTAVGSINARRDMPVGVAGEGGMISAIRVEAGQYVGKGQVLAEIDSAVQRAQLTQLQAAVLQAQADARLAQSELDRAQALVSRGFISKADIDRRTATRDSANARVTVAQAQVREMQERLNRLAIRAPEAGLVLQRMVEPGQIVSPGSGALYRVAAGGQMELRAEVAEQDMPGLKVGQTATIIPVGSENRYAGTVWLLEPVIDPQSRQGIARIALPQAGELRSGGFANVVIEGATSQRPLLPQSAVMNDNDGYFVYTVGADNVVKRVAVKTGSATPDGVVIREGLTGTERVVQSAGPFLHPGEKITPKLVERAAPAVAAAPAQR